MKLALGLLACFCLAAGTLLTSCEAICKDAPNIAINAGCYR